MSFAKDLFNQLNIIENRNKAIIYTRCSTKKQNEDNNMSLETQVCICNDYCIRNNMIVGEVIREVVGGHNIMKQFKMKQSLITMLDSYTNMNIIIADPSRLSRNVSNADMFVKECTKRNIILHFVRDNLTSNSYQDCKKILSIVYDATIESNVISKRITSSIKSRRLLGSHIGSKAPYGYKIINLVNNMNGIKIRRLVENIDENNIIKLIMCMYDGCSIDVFYKNYRKIKKNYKFKLLDAYDEEFQLIEHGNLWPKDIMILFNKKNIDKRGNKWKVIDIYNIIKNTRKNNSFHNTNFSLL